MEIMIFIANCSQNLLLTNSGMEIGLLTHNFQLAQGSWHTHWNPILH